MPLKNITVPLKASPLVQSPTKRWLTEYVMTVVHRDEGAERADWQGLHRLDLEILTRCTFSLDSVHRAHHRWQ